MKNKKKLDNGFKSWLDEFFNVCHFFYKLSPIMVLVFAFAYKGWLGLIFMFLFGFGLLYKNDKFRESIKNG